MAGNVNPKAVVPGESSPLMVQDPGRPHLTVSSQDSRLAEGTRGVLREVRGRQMILRFSQPKFGLRYKPHSLLSHVPIILIHYFSYFK